MLKVNSLIKHNAIFPDRFFILKGSGKDEKIIFPITEKYRDLLYLIISLHHIEIQVPTCKELLIETHYIKEFMNIKEELEMVYELLTGRRINLIFQGKTRIGDQSILNEMFYKKNPILFSGGVDSVSGSIKLLHEDPHSILLHIASSKTVFGKVKNILSKDFYRNTYTYCINSRVKSERDRTGISNTRGLLYLVSGFVLNRTLNSKKTYFCENGGQLLDVMLGMDTYVRSIATKNTNLRYLNIINNLINNFDDKKYNVSYLFKDCTKSELIAKYIPNDYVNSTWSCYNLRRSKMCGTCWNCFITNMSAISAGIESEYLMFEVNPLFEVIDKEIFLINQNILYDLLVFYEKVINGDSKVLDTLSEFDQYFKNPNKLAMNFGLDIYIGVKNILSKKNKRSGLGKKAKLLLNNIDEAIIEDRQNDLNKLTQKKLTIDTIK